MATTTNAFNDMMQQFLDELVLTFPNEKKLVKYQNTFVLLRKANQKKPLKEVLFGTMETLTSASSVSIPLPRMNMLPG